MYPKPSNYHKISIMLITLESIPKKKMKTYMSYRFYIQNCTSCDRKEDEKDDKESQQMALVLHPRGQVGTYAYFLLPLLFG